MTKDFQTGLSDLLDAHDIRYLSPVEEGRCGLPVGNGDLAAMVWTPPDRLHLTVNKSNAWDDAPGLPVPDWHWSPQMEEKTTALVSCATLSIQNHLPLYDTAYLDDFEARLHLREGYISVNTRSPICMARARVYVMRDPDVLAVDYDEEANEPIKREITLARWGSRRFFHWFSQISRDTGVGLTGTISGCDEQCVWIEQRLRRITFAAVARFVGAPVRMKCLNRHTARITTENAQKLSGQLYLAVVTSEDHAQPLAEARRRVNEAAAQGVGVLVGNHARRWAEFWSRSYVRIPNAYLENLYYFSRYQAGASSAGDYPPMHHGGLWMWNHDIGNWGAFYHWNEQQMVWPMHTAGHPELARGYYAWRYKGLDHAREAAPKVHGIAGAFYTDVSDRDGRLASNGQVDTHLDYNLTCGSQIAMDFWRHYQYTGDVEFLRERAYPVMREAARFYLNYLERDEEGVVHVPASTGYEAHLRVRDCVADLSIIRSSFAACIAAAKKLDIDADFSGRLQDALENLAEFALVEEKGQTVVATGIAIKDEPGISYEVGRSYKKGETLFYVGFWQSMAPAFPSGVVGLVQQGTPLFEAVQNAVRILGPTSPGGWIPSSVFAARLGMADEALEWLGRYVSRCQLFPQGFMQEGQYHNGSTDIWVADEPAVIRDGQRSEEKTSLLSRRHDVPAPECNCNLMTAIQEMLLQSHDEVIRVFPATPASWDDAAFRLYTVGGFVVTAEREHGKTTYVRAESTRGGVCRVANPWPGVRVAVREVGLDEPLEVTAESIVEFATRPAVTYLLRPASQPGKPLPVVEWATPAPGPRQGYGRFLGIPRYF